MKQFKSRLMSLLQISLLFVCLPSFALSNYSSTHHLSPRYSLTGQPENLEMIVAGSLSKVHAGNGQMSYSTLENDTLVQTNSNQWSSWGTQIGLGYVIFIADAQKYSDNWQWFPMFEPEINLYLNNYRNEGNLYLYSNLLSNPLDYNIRIRNARVMLDGALTILSKSQYSLYVIAGIGNSWSWVDYKDAETDGSGCNQQLSLDDRSNSNFVWEAGLGLAYAYTDKVSFSFEYLYTDFGKLKTSVQGTIAGTSTSIASPASFNLHTQALLLGLHVAIN